MSRFNLSAWAVSHPTLVFFFLLMLSAAGALAYMQLGRAEDPNFTIKVMNISVAWPGATAEEMQRLVAEPIEKTLEEVPHFDRVRTYARAGIVFLQLNLEDATSPADVPDLWYQVRKRVADMRQDLPNGVYGPFFNDEFGDVDSALYTLSGDEVTPRDLKDRAEEIRRRLMTVSQRREGALLRHAGRKDLRRVQPRQARHARHHAAADLRQSIARQNAVVARRHGRYQRRPRPRPGRRRAWGAGCARGRAGRGGGPQRSASATSPTVTRGYEDPPSPYRSPRRQERRRHRRGDDPRRQHPHPRRGPEGGAGRDPRRTCRPAS